MADDDAKQNEDPKAGNKDQGNEPDKAASPADKDGDGDKNAADAKDAKDGRAANGDKKADDKDDANKPASPSDPAAPDNPPGTPPLSTALNPQIVQAVGTTNHAVLNGAIPGANGVAYQKVAQAAAYAVQDSTDYLRNIMSMASATTGVAMQQMLATKEVDPYSKIIKAATDAVSDAQTTFSKVGTSASSVVKDFDSLA
ncbi:MULTISPECIES: hypothetical protein [unclassified Thalassospira]|uniref:hypothetical protein n=1 Tax=unclassified Thalassospira TaxID=2648997 RepID=UPI0007A62DF3|nr:MULTISPECIES: hypothetical protein [unclassified Thalassospira]KZC99889.1 hypothetical protein AUQ41_09525 [Thalassospira sp. MCCC 1A02898]ONH85938.1 hypothetical protein TH47_18185 [Thalassospira sp. MCCC 1A02803]